MLKRYVCFLLVCVMMVGSLPMQAYAQTEETTAVSTEVEIVPTETETIPAETETVPAETETVPAETETVPAETETVPAETETVPAETETVPAETEAVPAETEAIIEDEIIVDDNITSPLQASASVDEDYEEWNNLVNSIPNASPLSDYEIEDLDLKFPGVSAADIGDISKYENEYNNSRSTANLLYDNYTVTAKFNSSSDVDWYKISLSRKSYIEVICTSPTSTTYFGLYNSSGSLVASSKSTGSSGDYYGDVLSGNLAAGTYYLAFVDSRYYNNTYAFYYNTTPVAPKISSTYNSTSGVRLSWNSVSGASQYSVWRRAYGSSTSYRIATTSSTSYVDTSAVSGNTYYYYVSSNDTNTSYRSPLSAYKMYTYLDAPTITSRYNSYSGIQLKWSRSSGATGYAIYRQNYYGDDSWTRVATISSGSTTSWKDTSVKSNNGSVYRYRVRATYTNSNLYSSTIYSSYRTKAAVRLTNRYITSLYADTDTSFIVKWAYSSKVTGYQVRVIDAYTGEEIDKDTISNKNTCSIRYYNVPSGRYKIQVRGFKTVSGLGTYYSAWCTAKYISM